MNIFYAPDISNNNYTFSETESKHIIRVLRLKSGELINIIDGKGNFYTAKIISENPKKCQVVVETVEKNYNKRDFNLSIAIAPTKNNDRFEWFCEKATEIGIDKIIPIISFQSERRNIKSDRFKKKIISAVKQSLKAYIPEFTDLIKFKDLIEKDFDGKKYIAHCNTAVKEIQHLKELYKKGENVLILIGPEGDFTTEEVKQAIENGFEEITISKSRLRTETAGIVTAEIINFINE